MTSPRPVRQFRGAAVVIAAMATLFITRTDESTTLIAAQVLQIGAVPAVAGPQRDITCPAGAVALLPGSNLQRAVDSHPGRTVFCLKAGVHAIRSAITPKSGSTFVGEYGAILDGTGWSTTDTTQGAFRAHNEDIDDVTIRNLVIRRMPQRGIHAFRDFSDRWTIEYNELAYNQTGLVGPSGAVVRRNRIHHNVGDANAPAPERRGGAFGFYRSAGVRFEENDVYENGPEMKWSLTQRVTVRGNRFRSNHRDGIWFDGDNVDFIIENNVVEDHPGAGIFDEISGSGVMRNNTVRRSGETGVFISTSKDADISNNVLEDNFRGIVYFVDCDAVGSGAIRSDLANVTAHGNSVTVGAARGSQASGFAHASSCTAAQLMPYVGGAKKLAFAGNRYIVPSIAGQYWFWGPAGPHSFRSWQSRGLDQQGSVSAALPIQPQR